MSKQITVKEQLHSFDIQDRVKQKYNEFVKEKFAFIADKNKQIQRWKLWDQLFTNIFDFISPQLLFEEQIALVQLLFTQIQAMQMIECQYCRENQGIFSQKFNQILNDEFIAKTTRNVKNIEDFICGYKYLAARTVNKYGCDKLDIGQFEEKIRKNHNKNKQ